MTTSPSNPDHDQWLASVANRIEKAPRVVYPTYKYFLWPYKGLQPMDPRELDALGVELASRVPKLTEVLFTFQTDGEIVTLPLATRMQRPVIVCRDFHYGLSGLVELTQETAYWTRPLYCQSGWSEVNVCIVDALISTGATVLEAIDKLESLNKRVAGVIAVVHKPEYGGLERIRKRLGDGRPVEAIWSVDFDSTSSRQIVTREQVVR